MSLLDQPSVQAIYFAIAKKDITTIRRILDAEPHLACVRFEDSVTWLHRAADHGSPEIVDLFIDSGNDVNDSMTWQGPPLIGAIQEENYATAKRLLERGASPNLDRMLIAAINCRDRGISFEFVKLLVEYGIDVNKRWRMGKEEDESKPFFNALSWAKLHKRMEIADYLAKNGAVMPLASKATESTTSVCATDQIVTYFEKTVGTVRPKALVEIVLTSAVPIAIHVIKPTKEKNYYTLFTTGVSEQPMTVPEGAEEFQYAELVMFLPADWPMGKDVLKKREHSWPLHLLRQAASYPHNEDSWFGAPITIFAAEEPPQPFAPGCPFAAMLMIVNYEDLGPIPLTDGRNVQIYTLIPLFPEERKLEIDKGLPALFQGLDRHKIGKVVDLNRPNVATG